jgi:hypothetical protein
MVASRSNGRFIFSEIEKPLKTKAEIPLHHNVPATSDYYSCTWLEKKRLSPLP